MKKNLAIFALGFATPFAIPLTHAFISGLWIGMREGWDEALESNVIELPHN